MCDIVLVMMEVEEHFGIRIPDERAWRMNTVGDLYLYLLGQAQRHTPSPCPTSAAFYRLRQTLSGEFGVDRRRVRPTTQLRAIFPAATRGATWPRLAAALGVAELPDLPAPRVPSARAFRLWLAGVTAAWWLLYPAIVLVTGEAWSITYGLLMWFLLALLVAEWFGILWVAGRVDHLERIRVPTVRHLVVRLTLQQADSTPRKTWDDLLSILAAQVGLPAREIHPEQRFADLPDYC